MNKFSVVLGLQFVLMSGVCVAQHRGDVYEDVLPVMNGRNSSVIYNIPLSPGKWSVEDIAARSSGGTANVQMKDVRLIRVEAGVLQEALEITAQTERTSTNWNDEPCKIEPVLYRNGYGTKLWKQKCLTIIPQTFLQNNNETTRSVLKSLSGRGIKHDFNSLRVTYSRFGDPGKFLIIAHHFFPSIYGLDNPLVGIINTSSYHPSLIDQSSQKRALVDALSKHMEEVVASYDAVYERGEVLPVKRFDGVVVDSFGDADFDRRMGILDQAREAGLISQEEYDKKKAELLSR